jgi:hypothetical protein
VNPVVVVLLSGGLAVGCVKTASSDEVRQACSKAIVTQWAIAALESTEDPVKDAVAEFARRLDDLKARQLDAIEAIDQECLKRTGKPGWRKARVGDDPCVAARTQKALDFASEFRGLNQQKIDTVKNLMDARKRTQEAAREQMRLEVETCTAQALQKRITREKVACQLAAPTQDAFRECH